MGTFQGNTMIRQTMTYYKFLVKLVGNRNGEVTTSFEKTWGRPTVHRLFEKDKLTARSKYFSTISFTK